jgi:hypothetical protein
VRWITGLLLVGAAVLKTIQLFNEPTLAIVHPLGSAFLLIQISVEFAVGILALLGVGWQMLRWFVLFLFSGFAVYSFYLALKGEASCGCFGPVHVQPWWTFLIDAAVVLGLLIVIYRDRKANSPAANSVEAGSPLFSLDQRKLIAAAMAISVLATAFLVRYVDRRTAIAEGMSAAANGLVILEPEKWIGQKLPIAEFIDNDLSSGEWTAVLHRHDCSACLDALPRYQELASAGKRVALVEVPPYGDSSSETSACLCCRLKDIREWFVQTPTEIQLRDGIVLSAKVHGH